MNAGSSHPQVPPMPLSVGLRWRSTCAAALFASGLVLAPGVAAAQSDADELAKKLSNPVSSLISVPFQLNWDTGIGPDDEDQVLLNIQPVVPFSLGPKWTLIERVIVPIVDAPYGAGSGLSDVTFQSFFSPEPKPGGAIWGIGPVIVAPTATESTLGTEKWSAGPTFVVLKQQGPATYGILMLNAWSFAGASDRAEVNTALFQPFFSRALGAGRTVSVNLEATANWDAENVWTVPLNLQYSKVVRLGRQMASLGGGLKYYLEKPPAGPDWGVRLAFTLLFPK
jgi:hypothetical protein